uniref:Putative secreted protein n=1 Tax=Amblyomma aureolatum TaxID=187763 RepID=A0A1E1WY49_9ACAR
MRVNAKLLANYQRQTVCLVGRVLQCEPQGMSFKMESPDKQVVQIIMKKPIQEPLEGIIEVVGEVTAKLAIVCESYVLFPPALAENFDMASYNAVVETIQNSKDYYPTMASS